MMTNAGGRFSRQQVAARGFKEVEDGLVFPRRCVRHIDDDISAIHRFGQAFAGDAVYAGTGGGCEHVMAALAEVVHKFRSDEASASNDDDLHGFSPLHDGNHCCRYEQRVPPCVSEVLAQALDLPSLTLGFSSKKTAV
ncbi:hypothetical protein EMIT0P44_370053 [Pseudomonas sp. IT-P44]